MTATRFQLSLLYGPSSEVSEYLEPLKEMRKEPAKLKLKSKKMQLKPLEQRRKEEKDGGLNSDSDEQEIIRMDIEDDFQQTGEACDPELVQQLVQEEMEMQYEQQMQKEFFLQNQQIQQQMIQQQYEEIRMMNRMAVEEAERQKIFQLDDDDEIDY